VPVKYHSSNLILLNFLKTAYESQFDWGGHLLKSNGDVQRRFQTNYNVVERNGI